MLDAHTHFFAPELTPPSRDAVAQGWPEVVARGDRVEVLQHGRVVRILGPSAWDPVARLEELDRSGVESQVVMPTPFTFLYDAEPEVAIAYARAQNDFLAEFVRAGGGRFFGLGTVPLQAPAAAIDEISRVRTVLGLSGVEIGTHAGQLLLHDEELDPVFGALEGLGAAVFVHPWKPVRPDRTSHHGLGFGLARPVETDLAVGSLVFGGVLDRHPDLRVCLAHGGAGIPALRGRLGNGWRRQDPASRLPGRDPRVVLSTLWADGLTYDPMVLALAEDTFGADRMVLGSDYPFAAQETTIGASYRDAAGLGLLRMGADWASQTTANARAFLGSPGPRSRPTRPTPGEHDPMGARQ